MLTQASLKTQAENPSEARYAELWGDIDRLQALADDDDRIAQFLVGLQILLDPSQDNSEGVRLLQASGASMWYPAFIALAAHFRQEGDEANANRYANWAAEEGHLLGWALDYAQCVGAAHLPFAKYRFNEAFDRYCHFHRMRTLRPDEEFAADVLLTRLLLATWHTEHPLALPQIERLEAVAGGEELPFTRYVAFRAMAHDVPTLQPAWFADLLPRHAPMRAAYREVFYEMGCKAFHEGSSAAKDHWQVAEQFGDPLARRALQKLNPQHGQPLVTERRGLMSIKVPALEFADIDWSALYEEALHQAPDLPFPSLPHWHLTDWIRQHLHVKQRKN